MIMGKGTGKLGGMVFAQVFGEQIVREYQPNVTNPSTAKQVDQRARLKLASQLAQSVAPVIAIPRVGTKSGRNQFISINFDNITAEDGIAEVSLQNVQLTKSSLAFPSIVISGGQGAAVTAELETSAPADIKRVVYALFNKNEDGSLAFVDSTIIEVAGDDRKFEATLAAAASDVIVYAYGMKDASESATAKYGKMNVNNAITLAQLIASRRLNTSDYSFTQTVSATTAVGGTMALLSFDNHAINRGEGGLSEGPAAAHTVAFSVLNATAGVTYKFAIANADNTIVTGSEITWSDNPTTGTTDTIGLEAGMKIVLTAGGVIVDTYQTVVE